MENSYDIIRSCDHSIIKTSNEEDDRETFFIRLHLKKFCASILETPRSKLQDSKQDDINVWLLPDK